MHNERKPVPFDLIPSKWKAKFESRMLRRLADGEGFEIDSEDYRSLAEKCYFDDITVGVEFEALLSRAQAIRKLEGRPFVDVIDELEAQAPQKLVN